MPKTVFKGVVHGRTIELECEPGLPEGQAVSVTLEAIAEAARRQWQDEADAKLRESLAEYERGEGVPWKKGDCEKMVREYDLKNFH